MGLRLAYDAPEAVTQFAALDIVPTRHVYGHVDRRMATADYHWFFLIQRLECPSLVLWGEQSFVNTYDVAAVWAEYAADPQTAPVRAGHFLPEEAPTEVLDRLAPVPP